MVGSGGVAAPSASSGGAAEAAHSPVVFLDLPDDALLHMMKSLQPDDVLRLGLVNKRLNRLSFDNNLWFHMFVDRFGKTAALAKIREYELREEQRKRTGTATAKE